MSTYLLLSYFALSYLGALTLYRLFLHPLRKYPGPPLAAVSGGYEAYLNIIKGGGLVTELVRLHEVYGPVVRIGPNKLHFNDRRAYHDIYTHGTTLTKEPAFYHGTMAHVQDSSIYFWDPQKSKDRRAILSPLFSRRAVISLEYLIQQKIDKLVTLLQDHYSSPNTPVSLSNAYRALATDVITSYSFAESLNTLNDPTLSHPLLLGVQSTIKGFWVQRYFPFINNLSNSLPLPILLTLLPSFKGFVDMTIGFQRQIDRLTREPELLKSIDGVEHETIYHHLLEPAKGLERPPMRSLMGEAFTLVMAGSDTVANTCTVGTFYALKDPSIRRKLVEELKEAWPDKEAPMGYVKLEDLPYLTAFIKESLRFSIGIIHPLPRVVHESTPEIAGLRLAPGTIVSMSALFLHMNPDVFPNPHEFNPERWLVSDTTDMMHDLAPFSKGPRMCLGFTLAWCELYLIFANLFRKLDLKLVMEEDTIDNFIWQEDDHRDYFVPLWNKAYRVFSRELSE
ncbi:hypothetical protein GYMLUDRAFT_47885 [Collybiopsis luxurians FD-317 M1]|uniref:Unplaced genomic scaffold GYMLUscaffold_59, whole genome shotgun sequence n=1 Tax=Collybiopsis luxurians FD-317 M1 TaxID=944289 RepID=A0A0D0BKM7_9AGAR|nr:hypothetical protein GYMLUDRAFT_47885 [Collybiopsis luxurians FD-317 M1]